MNTFFNKRQASPTIADSAGVSSRRDIDFSGQLARQIHQRFLRNIEQDPATGGRDNTHIKRQIDLAAAEVQASHGVQLSESEILQVHNTIINEINGYGPLTQLMRDPLVSDILVNGPKDVWIDKNGRLLKTSVAFEDEAHVRRFLDRLVSVAGKHVDAAAPAVDARLNDGSRLHAIIPPLSVKGAIISIRRFREDTLDGKLLLAQGFMTDAMFQLLINAVRSRLNIVIAGGAGAGKTTLLNVLASHIPADERIITVEETAELRFKHPHLVSLESRAVNGEGRGEIGLRELVRHALRMRANRIILGEVRGEEVMEMLQAMNVGHDGSLTTVHANSAQDVVIRLETLALLGNAAIPRAAICNMISSALNLIVHIARFSDGRRRITSICELEPGNEKPVLREIFRLQILPDAEGNSSDHTHVQVAEPVSLKHRM